MPIICTSSSVHFFLPLTHTIHSLLLEKISTEERARASCSWQASSRSQRISQSRKVEVAGWLKRWDGRWEGLSWSRVLPMAWLLHGKSRLSLLPTGASWCRWAHGRNGRGGPGKRWGSWSSRRWWPPQSSCRHCSRSTESSARRWMQSAEWPAT